MNGNGKCISCGGALFKKPIYSFEKMPSRVQNLPNRDELKYDTSIPLSLFQCSLCGLIQFDCEPVEYWRESTRAGERSEALIKLNKKHFKHFIESYNLYGKRIIEVGCGKGGFLKTLAEISGYNLKLFGTEYNTEFVSLAKEQTSCEIFNLYPDSVDLNIEKAPFDAFYSFSFFARLINPGKVLRCIRNNLIEGGYGFLRAISQEYISNCDGFFEITHDLYAYYSKESLEIMLQQNGFIVLETWIDSPYVCAIVKKREPYNIKACWVDAEKKKNEIKLFFKTIKGKKESVAVWCASHYAFTVISVCDVGNQISYIIDNAPFKQGKYAPGSHVPIVSPAHFEMHNVDNILILSDYYVDEVITSIRKISKIVKIFSMNKNGIYRIQN